jgi:hypothetical protein
VLVRTLGPHPVVVVPAGELFVACLFVADSIGRVRLKVGPYPPIRQVIARTDLMNVFGRALRV